MKLNFLKPAFLLVGLFFLIKIIVVNYVDTRSFYNFAVGFNSEKDTSQSFGLESCKGVESITFPVSFYLLSLFNDKNEEYLKALSLITMKIANCQITHTDGASYVISDNQIYNYHPFNQDIKKRIYDRAYCGEQLRASCVFNAVINNSYLFKDEYIIKEFSLLCEDLAERDIDNYKQECGMVNDAAKNFPSTS